MGLAERWRKVRLAETGRRRFFSLTPGYYSLYREFRRRADGYLGGLILDAGAGAGAWAPVLGAYGRVVAADLCPPGSAGVTADLKRLPFPDAAFDTVFCSQVLEHEREPAALLAELHRVSKPGAALVLSAPHLSRLHDEPHDYYRYTGYGLRSLAEGAGFSVEEVDVAGGMLSFLGHTTAVFGLAVLGPVPIIGALARFKLRVVSPICAALDRALDPRGVFALNWMLWGRKP